MVKYQLKNGKVTKAEKVLERVREFVKLSGKKISLDRYTTLSTHKSLIKDLLDNLYSTTYVVNKVNVGINGEGQVYKSTSSNSPYIRALAKVAKDENRTSKYVELSNFDSSNMELVPSYKVYTNDKSQDKYYINADSILVLNFSLILNEVKESMSASRQDMDKVIEKHIANIISHGITIEKGMARLAKEGDKNIYNIVFWSNSNEKESTVILSNLDTDIAFKVIDQVSGGVIKSAIKRPRTISELIAFSKRIGTFAAPALEAASFGNSEFGCLLYTKKILGPSDYSIEEYAKLMDKNIEIDTNTFDGAFYVSDKYVQKTFKKYGINLSKDQASSMAIQFRSNVLLAKVFGEAKDEFVMKSIIDNIMAKVEDKNKVIKLAPGQKVDELSFLTDYEVVIVGNPDNIGIILDANGIKSLKDIKLKDVAQGNFMGYVLDVAKSNDTRFSVQMLQKIIHMDKEKSLEIYGDLMEKDFNDRTLQKLLGNIDVYNCSLAQYILRHVDSNCQMALRDLIDTELKQSISNIKKFNVKLKSVYLRALFDYTYLLTSGKVSGVLGVNQYTGKLEAYSPDVEKLFDETILEINNDDSLTKEEKQLALNEAMTGVLFKYPSPSPDENALFTFLTKNEIVDRILALENLDDLEKESLIRDFTKTSYGVIKMAPNNTIKHRLAGMDTDYDGVAAVFEKGVVDIIKNHYKGFDGITVKKGL